MDKHARVVVIGGGVVGVGTLYHLAKKGWSDVVLCERTELTAGSTWHAAGLLPLFNMSYAVGQLHKYSVDLYKSLEAETGQNVGFHVTGNLRLACTRDRMDEYRKYCGTANTIGVPFELITPSEVKQLWPLINPEGLIGALYHPDDGHIAPVDVTSAMAKGARDRGAKIYQQTEVLGLERTASGEWKVSTTKGNIVCEHVVCATGNYSQDISRLLGILIPSIPVQHQYIVTDVVPELQAYRDGGGKELAVLRESDASYYLREERMGYILGPYEKGAPAVFADGVPKTFEKDLFPGDLDRLMPHVEAAINRVPSFESAGIKDIVNGPIAYTPDGSPLIGPAWDLPNVWLNEGHSFGVTAAGGAGWQLAEWIVEGEPTIDLLAVDPRRYGDYARGPYLVAKNEEAYENVFTIHYPDEERPACRPTKTSPIHDRLDGLGAVWGQRYGWERPNWFAPDGVEAVDDWSFRRSAYFEHVGNEHNNIRNNVGIIDITSFSKFRVSGPGAQTYLDSLVARRLPKAMGRIQLCHVLTKYGGVRSEFTVTLNADGSFYLVSSGAAERFDFSFLKKHLPTDNSVHVENMTTSYATLVIAGPNSRQVLQKLTRTDLSSDAFPWLSAQDIFIGLAPVRAMRVNFVGELGWELHHPIEYQRHIFEQLMDAGQELDIGQCGMRAMDSLRIEKSYRMWGQDLTREYTILEAGLGIFVHMNKGDFTGREALQSQLDEGVPQEFVTVAVQGVTDADPLGNEPLWDGDKMIGRATAGTYGHYINTSLALGYVKTGYGKPGTKFEIEILGDRYNCVVVENSPHDPDNIRLKS